MTDHKNRMRSRLQAAKIAHEALLLFHKREIEFHIGPGSQHIEKVIVPVLGLLSLTIEKLKRMIGEP